MFHCESLDEIAITVNLNLEFIFGRHVNCNPIVISGDQIDIHCVSLNLQ